MAEQILDTSFYDSETEEIALALSELSPSTRKKRLTGVRHSTATSTIVLGGEEEEEVATYSGDSENDEEPVPVIAGYSLQQVARSFPEANIQQHSSSPVAGPSGVRYHPRQSSWNQNTQQENYVEVYIETQNSTSFVAVTEDRREFVVQLSELNKKNENLVAELENTKAELKAAAKSVRELLTAECKFNKVIGSRDQTIKMLQEENKRMKKQLDSKDRIIRDLRVTILKKNNSNKENMVTVPKKVFKTEKAATLPKEEKRGRQKAVQFAPVEENVVPEPENNEGLQQHQSIHRLVHPRPNQNVWECVCGATFNRSTALHAHLNQQNINKPEVSAKRLSCRVKTGKEVFPTEETRSEPVKAKQGNPKQKKGVKCDLCEKIFSSLYGLSGHKKVHNSNKRKADAEDGEPSSTTEQTMEKHDNKRRKSSRRGQN